MRDSAANPDETVMDPQSVTLSRAYALALADSIDNPEDLKHAGEELKGLAWLIRETPGCRELLADSAMNRKRRTAMVERVFAGRVSKPLENILGVLAGNGRLGLIETLAWQFDKVLSDRAGRVDVDVTVAAELSESEHQQLREILTRVLQAEPILHVSVDSDLLGGLVVKVGDTIYDGSVAGELAHMIEAMTK